MRDITNLFGSIFETLGWLLDFLGVGGFGLFLLTVILLAFVSSLSPLSKTANYLLVVGAVTFMAASGDADLRTIIPYLVIVSTPFLAVYIVDYLITAGRRMLAGQGRGTGGRLDRIEALSRELHKEIEALRDRQAGG